MNGEPYTDQNRAWAAEEMRWAIGEAWAVCEDHFEEPASADVAAVAVGLFASRVADRQVAALAALDNR